ncbi:hypothetical protein [Celeribacter halophilus]
MRWTTASQRLKNRFKLGDQRFDIIRIMPRRSAGHFLHLAHRFLP